MRSFWTILGVVVAVVIAWWLVDIMFSVVWFAMKLGIVAIVAVIVFFVLRGAHAQPRKLTLAPVVNGRACC